MSAQLIIETVGAAAGCLAVWLAPSFLLSQQIEGLREQQRSDHKELMQRIDAINAAQRSDHQHLVSLILQTRPTREEEMA